jgi:hypothetical protein
MPAWLIALLTTLIQQGATSLPQILAIGKANGMTDAEAAAITTGYDEAIARRDAAANAPPAVDQAANQ